MKHVQIKSPNATLTVPEIRAIENSYDQAVDRLKHVIREAQITLRDTNGPKGGVDKLCIMQLRFFPRGLAVVKSSGTTFTGAANNACEKMQQVLAKRLSKRKGAQLKSSQIELFEDAFAN
jgi:putative sigma-54 modulation protein